ncbi:MAG: CHAT domain-containing protein [Myxacorys chilensis ATA2-1-KO14]|jgi:Tfp pilus assembly protein PilF|nr:CHAT domain-containing protein [Myxacorys chilensis ATA2-1-KO14]
MNRRSKLLELLLSPLLTSNHFRVTVTQSPAGEGSAESYLPFVDGEQNWRSTLTRALELVSFKAEYFTTVEQDWMVKADLLTENRQAFHPDLRKIIGQALYRALIPPNSKVERLLNESIQLANNCGVQLLVQLKFEADTVQVAHLPDYPWELIHDGTGFLLHHQVGFSRYIAFSAVPPSLPMVKQVNVLLISSGACDKALGFKPLPKKERAVIAETLKAAIGEQRIRLRELSEPTLDELAAYLTQNQEKEAPHLLHFDGHGLFGKQCTNPGCRTVHKGIKSKNCKNCSTLLPDAQGYLLFEDEYGDSDYVSASQLGTILQQTRQSDGKHQTGGVVALVLSACQSGMAVEGESVFQGTAQNLIHHRVPAVVAMQYSVTSESMIAFARQFYCSIGEKNSLAVAVSQGRAMMRVDGNQWYRPVLYLRWRDNEGGQLFAASESDASTLRKVSIPQKAYIEQSRDMVSDEQLENVSLGRANTPIIKPVLILSTPQKNPSQRIKEVREIGDALRRSRHRQQFEVQNKLEVGASDFSSALSEIQPYIVDIAGCEDGIEDLFIEDDSNNKESIRLGELISKFFDFHRSVVCIILNGCYLEDQAREIVQHVEFVIGINQHLGERKILAFLTEFYFHLGTGITIQDSYKAGCYKLLQTGSDSAQFLTLLDRSSELQRQELEKELASCNEELESDPNNASLWRKRADILKGLNRPDEVTESYKKASLIEPGNYEIRAEKGDALEQFGMPEEAITAYDEALELYQDDYEVWWKKGKALVEVKKYREAMGSYEKALALKPPSPTNYVIYREYGFICEILVQYQKSITSYKNSLKLQPKYRAANYDKRRVYRKMYSGKS